MIFIANTVQDLLATTDLDPTVGALTRRINAGALLNKGVEFSIGSDWYNNGNFRIGSNVVFGFNKTTVEKLPEHNRLLRYMLVRHQITF